MLRHFQLVVEAGGNSFLLLLMVHGVLRGNCIGIDVLCVFLGLEDIGGSDGRIGLLAPHELIHDVALGDWRDLADERVGGSHC